MVIQVVWTYLFNKYRNRPPRWKIFDGGLRLTVRAASAAVNQFQSWQINKVRTFIMSAQSQQERGYLFIYLLIFIVIEIYNISSFFFLI
jgi:hypothetical protein